MSGVHPEAIQTRGGGSGSSRAQHEPPVRLLVALPLSGRTAWLAEQAAASAAGRGRGATVIWVRGDARGTAPHGVEDLSIEDLLARRPDQLARRTIALDDLHGHPVDLLAPLAEHLDRALDRGATVAATSIVVLPTPMEQWARRWPVRWLGQDALRTEPRAYTEALIPLGVFGPRAKGLHRDLDGWAGPLAVVPAHPDPRAISEESLAREAVDIASRELGPHLADLLPLPSAVTLLPTVSRPLLQAVLDPDEVDAVWTLLQRLAPAAGAADAVVTVSPALRQILTLIAPPRPDASTLRERAKTWYLAHDRYADAIRVVIEDGRHAEALALIREHQVFLFFFEGRFVQRKLMDHLPRHGWTPEDWLAFAVACITDGDLQQAAFVLRSPALMAHDVTPSQVVARELGVTYLGLLGHPPELAIAAARDGLRVLDDLPDDTVFLNAIVASSKRQYQTALSAHLARSQIVLGRWDDALHTLDGSEPSGAPMTDHLQTMFSAWVHGLRGDITEAGELAANAIATSETWPGFHPLAVEARLGLVEVHLQEGQLERAHAVALEALEGGTTRRSDHQVAAALVALAEIELRSGRPRAARARLEQITDGATGFIGQRAQAIEARALVREGAGDEASSVLRFLALDQHTVVAHAEALAQGVATPVSREDIEAWEPPPWRTGRLALADARAALAAGAGAGAQMGSTSPVLHGAGRLAAIERVAAAHDLSDRERDIVTALLTDGTLNEIADGLFISRNTLKTHLRGVYRKLGVHRREDVIGLVVRAELDAP